MLGMQVLTVVTKILAASSQVLPSGIGDNLPRLGFTTFVCCESRD